MSIAGLLIRFTLIYVGLMIGLSIVISLLGIKPDSAVNTSALIGAVLAACLWFANKNKRFLDQPEKKTAVLGMWGIDLAMQLLMTLGMSVLSGKQFSFSALLLAMAFIGVLHGIGIYLMVVVAGKNYAKQSAKGT